MFKVLVLRTKDLTETNIRIGWANAFRYLGHEVSWLEYGKSPLDLWFEECPDIVIIKQSELTESIVKAINKYGTVVFLFWEGAEQPLVEKIKTNIFWFKDKLYKAATGLNPLNPLPKTIYPAADSIRYKRGVYNRDLTASIIYVGSWHPRKAELLKYLEQRSKQVKVRIYGYGNWNHPLHVGPIESDELFSSILISAGQNIILNNNLEKVFKSGHCGACNVLFEGIDRGLAFLGHLDNPTYIDRVQEMLSCLKS